MKNSNEKLILGVDDDPRMLGILETFLQSGGYKVATADCGPNAITAAVKKKPNLILLDIMMPEMDGYQVARHLQSDQKTANIPVVFLTALNGKQDKAKAFALGAVDYLVKPVNKDFLLDKIKTYLSTGQSWEQLNQDMSVCNLNAMADDFESFKDFLFDRLNLDENAKNQYAGITHEGLYTMAPSMGVKNSQMARYIATFMNMPYTNNIDPNDILAGVLPTPFCKANNLVAVRNSSGSRQYVLSNPFKWELLDTLRKINGIDKNAGIVITEPENIRMFFDAEELEKESDNDLNATPEEEVIENYNQFSEKELKKQPVIYATNNIVTRAVSRGASDIHIEPKEDKVVVRFRIDGDMTDVFSLKPKTGAQVTSRFKVLGGLDIAEKRKPQDGGFTDTIDGRPFNFRVATTSTPYGESLIMRLLEPYAKPKEMQELGMTDAQTESLVNMINQHSGIILITGATGSGKSTSIYSLLHKADSEKRSLISVEDPIEYRIPSANQQQVNEKAGVTFDALLKSAVRQDPDILFMGEVRDKHSANIAMDFASTGHLTITTLHTSNATTAIFRLERLGLDRGMMANTVLGITAQRLIKKLCQHCKKIEPISEEEKEMLAPFADDLPEKVARPAGCMHCGNTGYSGREGVYEVLEFSGNIPDMVRSNMSIAEIRQRHLDQGGFLISSHAVQKVKDLVFTPKDVYEKVLVEELITNNVTEPEEPDETVTNDQPATPAPKEPGETVTNDLSETPAMEEPRETVNDDLLETPPQQVLADQSASILVVDDDKAIQDFLSHILRKQGYDITVAGDGIDGMIQMNNSNFDLVISDVNMPNLDGFKLVEVMNQKGVDLPVIFLTARTGIEDEIKGLELGAQDYITKPIQKKKLLLKVKSLLNRLKKGGK